MKVHIRTYFLTILGLFFSFSAFAQNQRIADSLEQVLTSARPTGKAYLQLLNELAENQSDPERKLTFSQTLIDEATQARDSKWILEGYLHLGTALRLLGELDSALVNFYRAARIADEKNSEKDLARVTVTIADVYSIIGNHPSAVRFYNEALDIFREVRDTANLAVTLINAGDEYFHYGSLDTARLFFEESLQVSRVFGFDMGIAYSLGNLGLVYAEQQNDALAQANIQAAVDYLTDMKDYYPISVYLLYMADIYLRKGDESTAINYIKHSLSLADRYGLREQISDAHRKLAEIYEQQKKYAQALSHFQDHVTYRDSFRNLETVQQMAELRTDFAVAQKQSEIDLLEKEAEIQRLRQSRQNKFNYAAGFSFFAVLIILFGLYRRNQFIKRTSTIIAEEQNLSDRLLRNILPAEIARELKENGKVRATRFESVTVLFTDFMGFTRYSARLAPEKLVESIDLYFSKFDEITEKFGLEKIKTVGDAYMCAGGMPFSTIDHAHKTLLAALEMRQFVQHMKMEKHEGLPRYDIRIGINSGPVVAGIVGTKKFAYDIWGDTVNIAARMEKAGTANSINISESTYHLIKDDFQCIHRGEVEVRHKGKMNMYFVEELRQHVPEDGGRDSSHA